MCRDVFDIELLEDDLGGRDGWPNDDNVVRCGTTTVVELDVFVEVGIDEDGDDVSSETLLSVLVWASLLNQSKWNVGTSSGSSRSSSSSAPPPAHSASVLIIPDNADPPDICLMGVCMFVYAACDIVTVVITKVTKGASDR